MRTASLHHANGDAMDLAVKDGCLVGIRGRAVDWVNHGRLDPKHLFVWQAYNSSDRLTKSLVRENGELIEASWGEAMSRIVKRSRQRLREKGPLAFGFYASGQLFLEDYYTLGVMLTLGTATTRFPRRSLETLTSHGDPSRPSSWYLPTASTFAALYPASVIWPRSVMYPTLIRWWAVCI